MSFFGKILEKVGIKKAAAATPPADAPAAQSLDAATAALQAMSTPEVAPIEVVDVVAQLTEMAAKTTEKLNWKTSIVDLLKLLGLDSSLQARRELATELGCPADKMGDSAQMNMWLHKEVLKRIAANGGNIPADLL